MADSGGKESRHADRSGRRSCRSFLLPCPCPGASDREAAERAWFEVYYLKHGKRLQRSHQRVRHQKQNLDKKEAVRSVWMGIGIAITPSALWKIRGDYSPPDSTRRNVSSNKSKSEMIRQPWATQAACFPPLPASLVSDAQIFTPALVIC